MFTVKKTTYKSAAKRKLRQELNFFIGYNFFWKSSPDE